MEHGSADLDERAGAPLDHDVAALLMEARSRPAFDLGSPVDDLRRAAQSSNEWLRGGRYEGLDDLPTSDDVLDGVSVRWYGADPSENADVIVYLHGGGWMVGNVESYDVDVRLFTDRLKSTVVSVDYRLSPEHPFPAAIDDCVRVVRNLAERPHRALGVAGDSAGGNLALGVALSVSQEKFLDAVLALYPVLDPTAFGNSSYVTNGDGYLLTTEAMRVYWERYASSDEARRDERVNIAAADLSGLPPTVIASAGYDPLRDEARAFAARLVAADTEVIYLPHPSLIHGFQQLVPRVPAAVRAVESVYDAYAIALRRAATARLAQVPRAPLPAP